MRVFSICISNLGSLWRIPRTFLQTSCPQDLERPQAKTGFSTTVSPALGDACPDRASRLALRKVAMGAASNSKEGKMLDHFNAASLATLSKLISKRC
jgi:hypothetical protein